jgi:hypothetical protein
MPWVKVFTREPLDDGTRAKLAQSLSNTMVATGSQGGWATAPRGEAAWFPSDAQCRAAAASLRLQRR